MSGLPRPPSSRSQRYPTASKAPRARERVAPRLLLDTHAFLWWVGDDPRLSAKARRTLLTAGSQLFLSAVSAWEIAIKAELGKLRFNRELESFMADHLQSNRITALPVSIDHALYVRHLPNHHRDPFDRLLVAQAMLEGMPIVSGDRVLAKYDIEVVW